MIGGDYDGALVDGAPCTFISQWEGTGFKLLPGVEPYCGKPTGQKV